MLNHFDYAPGAGSRPEFQLAEESPATSSGASFASTQVGDHALPLALLQRGGSDDGNARQARTAIDILVSTLKCAIGWAEVIAGANVV